MACHQYVGCSAVVEFLAAPPFVVLVVAPLVSVGVQDLCACHVDGGGHFVPLGEVEV
uniref:Minor tail protein n=1 Tax=Cutibacterium phage vB_CacS-HV1 TaxID=3236917 RepID=A0AB39CFD8_9CAUD